MWNAISLVQDSKENSNIERNSRPPNTTQILKQKGKMNAGIMKRIMFEIAFSQEPRLQNSQGRN